MVSLVIKKKSSSVNVRIYTAMSFHSIKIMLIFRTGLRLIDFDLLWPFESCVLLVVSNLPRAVTLYLCCHAMLLRLRDDSGSGCVRN